MSALPNVVVAFAFLNDYLSMRTTDWESTQGRFIQVGTQVIHAISSSLPRQSFFSSSPVAAPEEVKKTALPNKEAKTEIIDLFMELVLNAKTHEDWINIILDLGKHAREILEKDKKSLLGHTLHALRTYIIACLQQKQEVKNDSYEVTISALWDKIKGLDETIFAQQSQGLDVSRDESERLSTLYQLADLGNDRAIFECKRLGKFDPKSFPEKQTSHELTFSHKLVNNSKININKPWYFHPHYFLIHHENHVRPKKKGSFEDFQNRASQEYPNALQEFRERQQMPNLVLLPPSDTKEHDSSPGATATSPVLKVIPTDSSSPQSSSASNPAKETNDPEQNPSQPETGSKEHPPSPTNQSQFNSSSNLFPTPAAAAEEEEKKRKEKEEEEAKKQAEAEKNKQSNNGSGKKGKGKSR